MIKTLIIGIIILIPGIFLFIKSLSFSDKLMSIYYFTIASIFIDFGGILILNSLSH